MIVEPFANDRIEDNLNPAGRIYYSALDHRLHALLAFAGGRPRARRAGGREAAARGGERGRVRALPQGGGDAVQSGVRGKALGHAGEQLRSGNGGVCPGRPDHDRSHQPALPRRPRRQLPSPRLPARSRDNNRPNEITPAQLRAVEDKAIAEIVRFQDDVGLQSHHRRRVPPHLLPHRLPRQARRRQDRHPRHLSTPRRHRGTRAARHPRHRQGPPRQKHPARRLRIPEVAGLRPGCTPKVTIPSPTMLHFRGGRAGISSEAYPELEPAFYDDVARAYGDELHSPRRRRLHLRADGRHQHGLSLRREDARSRALARRRPQRAAAPLRRLHQQGRGAKARRHDARHAPVPRQLQEHPRRRAATTSRWPKRCCRR